MDHIKQNEAKTNRKRPTIGFSPLDVYFSHYTIISVNAKKRSDASGDPADASRYPVMLLDIRRCPNFSVDAPNFPEAFPPSLYIGNFSKG